MIFRRRLKTSPIQWCSQIDGYGDWMNDLMQLFPLEINATCIIVQSLWQERRKYISYFRSVLSAGCIKIEKKYQNLDFRFLKIFFTVHGMKSEPDTGHKAGGGPHTAFSTCRLLVFLLNHRLLICWPHRFIHNIQDGNVLEIIYFFFNHCFISII